MKNYFSCPKCNTKLPLKKLFTINPIVECPNCKAELEMGNVTSFKWGYTIGFAITGVLGHILLYFTNNFALTLSIVIPLGIIAIIGVSIHTYINASFKEKD